MSAIARPGIKARRAEVYRQRAAQLRALAEQLSGDGPRVLKQAAIDYDRMAAKADGVDGKTDGTSGEVSPPGE